MNRPTSLRDQRGMSIVELMVATVISLIGVIVIFQVFEINEGVRRSTTSGSDEQTSGLMGLMTLERDLRHAGFGINDMDIVSCKMNMYDAMRTPTTVPEFTLSAVEIVSNNGTTPDVLRVVYGGTVQTTAAVKLGSDMDDPAGTIQLVSRFGFNTVDVLVIGQPKEPCSLIEVTGMPGLVELEHQATSYVNSYTGESQAPRFNNPSGVPTTYRYLANARVLNMGPFPVRNEYTVVNNDADPAKNNKLVAQNIWGQVATFQPVAEQIVHLKAEYGMDDGKNDGTVQHAVYVADDNLVDHYTPDSPAIDDDWKRIRSVRLAIVSRSLIADKPPCQATPAYSADVNDETYPVRWARGPDTPKGRPIDVRTTPDWQCYRYRVYETTVPLRNMLWRQE